VLLNKTLLILKGIFMKVRMILKSLSGSAPLIEYQRNTPTILMRGKGTLVKKSCQKSGRFCLWTIKELGMRSENSPEV